MQLGVIVMLVFIASTAALMGIFLLISRRSGSAADKAMEKRLNEATGVGARRRPSPARRRSLRTEAAGQLDRVGRARR